MDRLYTLIIIVFIGLFVYWYHLKQTQEQQHINKKHKKHKKHKKKKKRTIKKVSFTDNLKKENIKKKQTINNDDDDDISIESLESRDYNSLLSNKKIDSDSDFLND